MCQVSIIIPFYNSGLYIHEAINSVFGYNGNCKYEIIIVNDGSNEQYSIDVLKDIEEKYDLSIINQVNKGPGAARNAGVKLAKGKYLLFLDSDNKINPAFFDKAVQVFENNQTVGVVYANATFFGENNRKEFKSKNFAIYSLLLGNYIDMCSFVRKEAFESAGGFDENPLLNVSEDWDLWIGIYGKQWRFYYINENLFYYRVRSGSLMGSQSNEQKNIERGQYVFKKHIATVMQVYWGAMSRIKIYEDDQNRPIRTFFKFFFRKLKSRRSF
jgi:glycosyltransferase involved in cell wall biosynthesis